MQHACREAAVAPYATQPPLLPSIVPSTAFPTTLIRCDGSNSRLFAGVTDSLTNFIRADSPLLNAPSPAKILNVVVQTYPCVLLSSEAGQICSGVPREKLLASLLWLRMPKKFEMTKTGIFETGRRSLKTEHGGVVQQVEGW